MTPGDERQQDERQRDGGVGARDPRRSRVSYDPYHFDRLHREGRDLSLPEKFGLIHEQNLWHGPESRSGEGSGRTQTQALLAALPALLRELGVEVLLDVPCGAFGWIEPVADSVRSYVGGDVVPAVIAENERRHGGAGRRFAVLDLTRDALPSADLVLCRDCLVHLSFEDALAALANLASTRAAFLLTTTFTGCRANEDIVTGDWRPLNLERPPFDLPPPLRLLGEHTPEGGGAFPDKALGLWPVPDLAALRGRAV